MVMDDAGFQNDCKDRTFVMVYFVFFYCIRFQ